MSSRLGNEQRQSKTKQFILHSFPAMPEYHLNDVVFVLLGNPTSKGIEEMKQKKIARSTVN